LPVISSEYRDAVAKVKSIVEQKTAENSKYISDTEGVSGRRERKTLKRYEADDFNVKRRRDMSNSQAGDDRVEEIAESDSDSDIVPEVAKTVVPTANVDFEDVEMAANDTWVHTGN
jgi:hypothetical protein